MSSTAMMWEGKYIFKPTWRSCLLLAIGLPTFIALGLWQLHRADERTHRQELRDLRLAAPPLRISDERDASQDLDFRPVRVSGWYDADHQILLDNQVQNGIAGYHVFTPLRVKNQRFAILVNRGWLPLGVDRNQLPKIWVSNEERELAGIVDHLPRVAYRLPGGERVTGTWPARVQWLDLEALEDALGYRVMPYQVLLSADEADGYQRDWRLASADPAQNVGYAIQWFSFAAISLFLFVRFGLRKRSVTTPAQ